MRLIGLAGFSGSGKTTLLAKLLPALIARGRSVSTIKHAHHGFDVDQPGKDSHAHRLAGAREVLVSSARRWALMHELRGDPEVALRESRLGELIVELGGTLDFGSFPMRFTGYHDLDFDFLLKKLIEDQRRLIAIIEQCASKLSHHSLAKALAEEAMGAAKGHLESLLELQQPALGIAAP